MGYARSHHKKKGKCEVSGLAAPKAFNYQVKHIRRVLVDNHLDPDFIRYWADRSAQSCCPSDTCNNGTGVCDGSCKEWGRN